MSLRGDDMHPHGSLLYFEQQRAAFCAVHALNTLLQGPYFTEVDLAEIAQELDMMEKALLDRAVSGEHGNVEMSGMFSTQVLEKALGLWDLEAIPLASPRGAAAASNPTGEQAFICNLDEHWFTLRKCNGDWWNFNSMLSAPEPLSSFYLGAFLSSLRQGGYTVYVIHGSLPKPADPTALKSGSGGVWILPEEARKISKSRQSLQGGYHQLARSSGEDGSLVEIIKDSAQRVSQFLSGPSRIGTYYVPKEAQPIPTADNDEALQQAISFSQQDSCGFDESSTRKMSDSDLNAAILASLQDQKLPKILERDTFRQAPSNQNSQIGHQGAVPRYDTEAYEKNSTTEFSNFYHQNSPDIISIEQYPTIPALDEEPIETGSSQSQRILELALKLPEGHRASRKFLASACVSQLYAWAAACGVDIQKHRIASTFPRRIFNDWTTSLEKAGIENKQLLYVEGANISSMT